MLLVLWYAVGTIIAVAMAAHAYSKRRFEWVMIFLGFAGVGLLGAIASAVLL